MTHLYNNQPHHVFLAPSSNFLRGGRVCISLSSVSVDCVSFPWTSSPLRLTFTKPPYDILFSHSSTFLFYWRGRSLSVVSEGGESTFFFSGLELTHNSPLLTCHTILLKLGKIFFLGGRNFTAS